MQEKFIAEKRLLVAEDNSINLLVLSRFLETFGYGFDAVGNGLDCLNLINENFYDLVLTDISMPEMDGLQLATEIRAMTDAKRDIPIIAMTANAETEAAERFVKAGINEVLAKPFDKTELKYCIERWL